MQLTNILTPEAIKVVSSVSSKKRLFHEIADISNAVYGVDADVVASALHDREALGPTGVGEGVALPHARLAGLDRVVGVFIRLDQPLDFAAVDRKPVDLAFALLAPEEAGVEHLKALALVARSLRNSSLCAKLRANKSTSLLHTILTEQEEEQAA